MQKIVNHLRLQLRNIASFRAFSFDLTAGTVTELSGRNGSGKTTALSMLRNNLTGKPCKVPDWMVTECEDSGDASLVVDEQVTVRRHIESGATATELTLIGERGLPMERPAETLKGLFGDGSYLNPVQLVEMSTKERTKAITQALSLDPVLASALLGEIMGEPVQIQYADAIFPAIKEAHDGLYEARRRKRAEAEAADAQAIGVLQYLPDEFKAAKEKGEEIPKPIQPASLGDTHDHKAKADARNNERRQLRENLGSTETFLTRMQNDLDGEEVAILNLSGELLLLGNAEDTAEIEEQIRQLQQKLTDTKQRNFDRAAKGRELAALKATHVESARRLADFQGRAKALQARADELGADEDVAHLQAAIDRYGDDMEVWQQAIREHGEKELRYSQADELKSKAAALWLEWGNLEKAVKATDDLPLKLLEGVALPIPGMLISGDRILLPDGESLRFFEQFGEGDRLRFAAQLAMSLCPVNVLLMDGVEKLDPDNRLVLYRAVAEQGFLALTTLAARGDLAVNQYSYADLTTTE